MARILVIEDERSVRENIIELLQLEGFKAVGAENGQEGYFLATTELFDLVICDIMLPKLDGFEVVDKLRRHPRTITLPVIFLTAKTQRESQRQGMNLGAEDYITKPFSRKELLSSIQTRLERKKVLDESMEQYMQSVQKQLSYQMPLEFISPISIILHLSEMLTNPDKNQYQIPTEKLGKQINDTAMVLMEVTQKYLFLSDLERKSSQRNGSKTEDVSLKAGETLLEILKDIMHQNHQEVRERQIEEFDCALLEEDFSKYCEFVSQFVVYLADIHHPIQVSMEKMEENTRVKVSIKFQSLVLSSVSESDRRTSEFYQLSLTREKMLLARIAHLLNSQLQFNLDDHQFAEIIMILPLPVEL